jgi:hypothetical protein
MERDHLLPAVRIVREAGRRIATAIGQDASMENSNFSVLQIDAMLCDVMVRAHAYPTASVPVVLPAGHRISDLIVQELKGAWMRVARLRPCDCYDLNKNRPCLACREDMRAPLPMHWQRYKRKWIEWLSRSPTALQETIPLLRVFEPVEGCAETLTDCDGDRPHILEMIQLPDVRYADEVESTKCDDIALCVICMENRPDVVMLNCLHMCVCSGCMKMGNLETCPCCRKEVFKAVKVFT